MIAKHKNPYFNGTLLGVRFRQQAGGAVASVTKAQASALAAYTDISFETEAVDEPATTPELKDIKGLGKARVKKLAEAKIETVAALLEADADELAAKTEIDETTIKGWQDQAAAL